MKYLLSLAVLLFAANAHAVDYINVRITGIGIVAGEEHIRFTIDQDPNVIFRTNQYSGDQLKRLVALVMAAYTAQSPVYLVRSNENTSSSQRHYVDALIVSVGTYTFDG